ncbi:MAG: MFS transporter [Desulforhopalus sp.]|nr:MFS transporter [Desulforhopalus sp.]
MIDTVATVRPDKEMAVKPIFRSLGYRNFRLYFAGQGISLIGSWIQRIATPWLVYDLTGSVFLLGLVGFVGQIPISLFSPFAGVFTDRWNRYHILLATQFLAMVQAGLLSWLVLAQTIEVWQILVLSGLLGCVHAFDIPARQAIIVLLVDRREDLSNAIALNSSIVNGAKLLGPALAGVLIATAGTGVCFLLNALSYFFVIGSLLGITFPGENPAKERKPVLTELAEGISYAFAIVPIRRIIFLLFLTSLVGMPYAVLMPVYAREILGGAAETYGFLMGASGLGAVSGAFYLASRTGIAGLLTILPLSAGTFGTGLILLSLSRSYPLSLALMVLIGLGMMLLLASANTLLQNIVADRMRGRVMSFFTLAVMGTAPFGSFLAGTVAGALGVPQTMLLGGGCSIAGAVLFTAGLPAIRRMADLS